jgi:hypothetical protein
LDVIKSVTKHDTKSDTLPEGYLSTIKPPKESMNDIALVLKAQAQSNDLKLDSNGCARFSQKAVAKIVGINDSVLSRAFQPTDVNSGKLAAFLAEYGIQPSDFLQWKTAGIPDTAVSLIIQWYASFAGQRCTQQARHMAVALAAIGLRAYVQKALNHSVSDSNASLPGMVELEKERRVAMDAVAEEEKKLQAAKDALLKIEVQYAELYLRKHAEVGEEYIKYQQLVAKAKPVNKFLVDRKA